MPPLHVLALGAWFVRHGPVQHGIRIVPQLDGPAHTEPRIGHRPVRLVGSVRDTIVAQTRPIGRLQAELPFEVEVLEIERLADEQSGEP
jgi:hypothetical protein